MSFPSMASGGDPYVPAYVRDRDRLAALERSGLLDGGSEEEFDRFTRMAARLTEAPIARLSLVDGEGQHFKSAVGALPESGRSTPLTHAICKHVVGDRAAVSIPDTAADPRVAGNGAVTEHGTGAYLGHPVHSPDGHVLGALCVADPRARDWSPRDVEILSDLARAVETELNLRAALTAAHVRVYRDALTGLGNRRALSADLEHELAGGRPVALVLADLDGFKTYNDRYGHAAGDRLLVQLARSLRRTVEGLGGHAYRMSGDEFCAMFRQPPGACEPLRKQVVRSLQRTIADCPIGASAGSVCAPTEAESAEDALLLADERMYAHKRSGRLSTSGQLRLALRSMLAVHDPVVARRGDVAGRLAGAAAEPLGLDAHTAADVVLACELADLGTLAVGAGSGQREHPLGSAAMLESIPALAHLAPLVRAHHERLDGSGHPDGRSGDQLSLPERLVSAAVALVELSDPMATGEVTSAAATAVLGEMRVAGHDDPVVLDALSAAIAKF